MRALMAIILVAAFLSGCTQVKQIQHLSKLLTLQARSENTDMQTEYVEWQNANFERLVEATRSGAISNYPDQRSFVADFGEPLFEKDEDRKGQPVVTWLYRYSVRYSGEKVYLYFDQAGKLVEWEHVSASDVKDS